MMGFLVFFKIIAVTAVIKPATAAMTKATV